MWFAAAMTYGLVGWFVPWWFLMPVMALWGAFADSYRRAAGTGFLAVAATWICLILGWDFRGHGVVSYRLSGLFGINNIYLFMAIVVTAAGFIGAVSAVSGRWIRNLISE